MSYNQIISDNVSLILELQQSHGTLDKLRQAYLDLVGLPIPEDLLTAVSISVFFSAHQQNDRKGLPLEICYQKELEDTIERGPLLFPLLIEKNKELT